MNCSSMTLKSIFTTALLINVRHTSVIISVHGPLKSSTNKLNCKYVMVTLYVGCPSLSLCLHTVYMYVLIIKRATPGKQGSLSAFTRHFEVLTRHHFLTSPTRFPWQPPSNAADGAIKDRCALTRRGASFAVSTAASYHPSWGLVCRWAEENVLHSIQIIMLLMFVWRWQQQLKFISIRGTCDAIVKGLISTESWKTTQCWDDR